MLREEVLKEIGSLLDEQCAVCPMQQERNLGGNKNFSKYDRHCLEVCEVGAELKRLGVFLDKTVRPRVQVEEEGAAEEIKLRKEDGAYLDHGDWPKIAVANGILEGTYYKRTRIGWPAKKAATTPTRKMNKR